MPGQAKGSDGMEPGVARISVSGRNWLQATWDVALVRGCICKCRAEKGSPLRAQSERNSQHLLRLPPEGAWDCSGVGGV